MEELLDLVVELVGLLAADVFQPRLPAGERTGGRRLFQKFVLDAVQLEREEQKIRRGVGDLLLRVAIKLHPRRIAGIGRIEQAGVGDDAAEQIVEVFVSPNGFGQSRARVGPLREIGELAPIGVREGFALGERPGEVGGIFGRVHARIEIAQVPFGHRSEVRDGRGGS